jgi:hypothetical protein
MKWLIADRFDIDVSQVAAVDLAPHGKALLGGKRIGRGAAA